MTDRYNQPGDETRREGEVTRMRDLAMFWVNSQPVVSAYISANVVDTHHVEDILQEVAQVCAEKFDEYDRERSFISWAMGIARNRILKYYRTRSRDRIVLSEAVLERLEGALEKLEPEAEDRRESSRDSAFRKSTAVAVRSSTSAIATMFASTKLPSTSACHHRRCRSCCTAFARNCSNASAAD